MNVPDSWIDSQALWLDHSFDTERAQVLGKALQALASTAAERDQIGGAPHQEAALFKSLGLTTWTLSLFFRSGGLGPATRQASLARWRDGYHAVRRIARVDASAAALLGYNYMALRVVEEGGESKPFSEAVKRAEIQPEIWGGASNPAGSTTTLRRVDGGYLLHGRKTFATGSQTADWIAVNERDGENESSDRLFFVLSGRAQGVVHEDDWNSFGMRRSASGSVRFDNVFVPDADITQRFPDSLPRRTWNGSIGLLCYQVNFINLLVGATQGAIELAVTYLRTRQGRPAGSEVAEVIGDAIASTQAAAVLADRAIDAYAVLNFDLRRAQLHPGELGRLGDLILQAKFVASRTANRISAAIFEATGARSSLNGLGLDRFWRDIRVASLHDSHALKAQDIGRFNLAGRRPEVDPATTSIHTL